MEGFSKKYELKDRISAFCKKVILLASGIHQSEITGPLVVRVLKLAGSIDENYLEMKNTASRNDYINRTLNCKKETQEIEQLLDALKQASPDNQSELSGLLDEARELIIIFQMITSSLPE
jgi:four helix bundle protein